MIGLCILIIIIILLIYPRYIFYNSFHKQYPIINLPDIKFKTGDIIMYKYETPVYYKQHNKIHTSFYLGKEILNSFSYYFQNGTHYSHAGIIIVINDIPYLWHLTDDPYYDIYTKKVVIGKPSLCAITDIDVYRGVPYIIPYKGPKIEVDNRILDDIYKKNIYIQGNFITCILTNGLKLMNNKENEFMCLDFVELVLYYMGILTEQEKRSSFIDFFNHLNETEYYNIDKPIIINNGWFRITNFGKS